MSTRAGFDVAVIGGGIIGTSAAAFLAEAGRSVIVLERETLAAGASGRNSGALQQPFDPALGELHRQSVELYRELAAADAEFALADRPAGLLLVAPDGDQTRAEARRLAVEFPALQPQYLPADEARRLEPALGEGIGGCLLATGYPVVPAAATLAYGRRAQRAGVEMRTGTAARPAVADGRVSGVLLDDGRHVAAGQVLVAAGPWSPTIVPGWQSEPPIRPTYGVVISTSLPRPARHVLEELGHDPAEMREPVFFSLVTAAAQSSVGSTFYNTPPEPSALAPLLLERGARFVPQLADAAVLGMRVCQRPVSYDGRPLIGPLFSVDGLYVCAGHGPWGLSTGPACSRLIADEMLGRMANGRASLPPELATDRLLRGVRA